MQSFARSRYRRTDSQFGCNGNFLKVFYLDLLALPLRYVSVLYVYTGM
jgi:hypothetical protein